MASGPVFELQAIHKGFPGVQALKGVDFSVYPGEVHCLVGENGAGKSTLIKIMAGVYQPDAGTMRLRGQAMRVGHPHEAQALGLSFIFQELNIVEQLSVADNITLGREQHCTRWERQASIGVAQAVLDSLGLTLDPTALVRTLSPAERQLVMIARALTTDAAVIVMDEPTAPLTEVEIEQLFTIIARLKARGIAIVYVSHRLDEIFRIGDRITIFRDGQRVATVDAAASNRQELIGLMVGRTLSSLYARRRRQCGAEVLRLEGVGGAGGKLHAVQMRLHAGEILGIAGLVGSGRTELAQLIFGREALTSGAMWLDGAPYAPRSPRDAIANGLGLVPEERRAQGIVSALSVRDNISLAASSRIARLGFIRRGADRQLAEQYREQLTIRTPSVEQRIRFLSGGNQQKAVIAKWLATGARVLLFDEPTRGVDVGAKAEIFQLIDELAFQGAAVVMISSEMEEILGMSDRIAVMHQGTIAGVLEQAEATQERVMLLATGGKNL